MWDLAVREADYRAADSLLLRYRGEAPLSMRLFTAAARGDSAEHRRLLDDARKAENRQPQIAGRYFATYLEDLPTARSLARLNLAPERRLPLRAGAQFLLAWLEIAAGRWAGARDQFAAAEQSDETATRINRALAVTLPFLAPPVQDLDAVRADLERWNPSADQPDPDAGLPSALRPQLRLYLLGLVYSRLGDDPAALGLAARLERLTAPPEARAAVRGLAATIRADVAARRGRVTEALEMLERAAGGDLPLELVSLPAFATVREYGQDRARYLRAELLTVLKRDGEAIRWLESSLQGAPNEFVYLGPIHRLQAEIHERRGEREKAAEHYERFINLWKDCDPELAPQVQEAKARLVQLSGEPRRPQPPH